MIIAEETLECPCCGDIGAVSDTDGMFIDGQPLWCGCHGAVACDDETDPWITTDCGCGGDSMLPNPWPAVFDHKAGKYIETKE